MRLVYMGSPAPAIAPLAHLLASKSQHPYEVLAVVSQPASLQGRGKKKAFIDPPVAAFAKEQGLLTLQPEKARDPGFLAELAALAPDVIITCAYGQILTQDFLKIPKRATINIHPSRLPQYRGATPVQAALLAGDTSTAVSILFTVQALDAGALIVQEDFPIPPTARAGELLQNLFSASGELLLQALDKLADPHFSGQAQDEAAVSHCRKIDKESGLITWASPAATIYQRFRAFHPWPGSFCQLAGVDLQVVSMRPAFSLELAAGKAPGDWVYLKEEKALAVAALDAWLLLDEVKPAGGKVLRASEFWNGYLAKTQGAGHGSSKPC